mgnify:CR=1 FL=1
MAHVDLMGRVASSGYGGGAPLIDLADGKLEYLAQAGWVGWLGVGGRVGMEEWGERGGGGTQLVGGCWWEGRGGDGQCGSVGRQGSGHCRTLGLVDVLRGTKPGVCGTCGWVGGGRGRGRPNPTGWLVPPQWEGQTE